MSNLNNKKIMVSHYSTYGKVDNPKLRDSIVMDYDSDKIKELINELGGSHVFFWNSIKDFIQGKIDTLNYDRDGTDWDEPTGGYFVIQTYEETIEEIDEQIKKLEKEKKKLAKKFGLNKE